MKTLTTTFTGDIDSAKSFSSRSAAKRSAATRGLTRATISRQPAFRGEPDNYGGWIIIDDERSRPSDPWFVKS